MRCSGAFFCTTFSQARQANFGRCVTITLHRAIRSFLHILKPRECAHYYKHAGYAAI